MNPAEILDDVTGKIQRATGVGRKQAAVDARLLIALASREDSSDSNGRLSEHATSVLLGLCRDLDNTKGMLQHHLGWQLFCTHLYRVVPDVLVCHPSTELLVGLALTHLQGKRRPLLGIEIGVGSGVISIELLRRILNLKMMASDCSGTALEITHINRDETLVDASDQLELLTVAPEIILEPFIARDELHGRVDFIISNPPYIVPGDDISASYNQYMPERSIYSPDPAGMYFYREIAKHCTQLLRPGGRVFLEVRTSRASSVVELFTQVGWSSQLHTRQNVIELMQLEQADPDLLRALMEHKRTFGNHGFVESKICR